MKTYNWGWLLFAGAMMLIAVHGVALYYFSSHLAASVAAITGVITLILIKHVGLLRPLYAKLQKVWRRS